MIRLFSTSFVICLVLNSSVFAESACQNPVFGHSAIAIDYTAETANEAQRLSLAEAHRSALDVVLDRVLIDDVPVGFGGAPEQLVELVHIRTETSLPGRYIADIDICFAPDQLRALFAEANLAWAEVESPPVLVLPVFADGAGTRAWQASHWWLSGWRDDTMASQQLLQLTQLQPTLVNERQIRAELILQADEQTLKKAAERAKAEQILWSRAAVSLVDDAPTLVMEAIIFDKNGQVIAAVNDTTFTGAKSDYRAAAAAFRQEVMQRLETGWQKANERRDGQSNSLITTIMFEDHKAWISKKAALMNLPVINNLETLSVTAKGSGQRSQAVVQLDMNGSLEALRYALIPIGLSLSYDETDAVIE